MYTQVWFASELKAIVDQQCEHVQEFPDGHYWTPEEGFVQWYKPEWDSDTYVHTGDAKEHNVRGALAEAVRAQCMSDVPFGLLLSGGLDSAVVATLLKPIMEDLGQVCTRTEAYDSCGEKMCRKRQNIHTYQRVH